ncbi:carbohydrate-binding module family 1 protein [Tulasnella calospora MUT 4182]|uniref:Carbohydrate-binding module family 1 protein n=1 Tax=Tulasnella calospora MUT 4182 TaxID=1051891 RepID=A0A0C3MBK0_9AGAM|nr:carbohydrate-binding module family 1 protein [Tulasnella calospora MUT 4182]
MAIALASFYSIFNQDLADLDIRRVNSTYYYSPSTMHYSPGAPILRSYDLQNWEYIGHSVPTLDFGSTYSLIGGQAYVQGIWASFFGYHATKNTWYWGGCIDFSKSYIYSASSVTGPWSRLATINKCYYDCGWLVDDDGTMYVSYVYNNNIWVAQLASDAKSEVKSQQVYVPPSDIGSVSQSGYLEGTRFYKRNGLYYILGTHPATSEYVLKSSSVFGTYTIKALALSLAAPISVAGNPHQGGLVDTPSGQWYYMAFMDAYPGGRIPVMAPVTWGSDGFPTLTLVNGAWGASYASTLPTVPVASPTGPDYFTSISPNWEWNHNPDTSKFSTGSSGLTLYTVTVTNDLYAARNTITRRILGPVSTATIKLNYSTMKDGDRAGLVLLRDSSAWVGVKRDSGTYTVCYTTGLTMNSDWSTASTGTTTASVSISGGSIWLRLTADIAPGGTKQATFSYSIDGTTFSSIGSAFTMGTNWQFFMGHRFGIFNYATSALGGYVTVPLFQLDAGTGTKPSSVSTTVSQTTTTTTTSTSKVSTTTSKATTTTTAGGGCTATHYAQCGGIGYTGCTSCETGTTCTYQNDWYSQCL